MEVTKTTWDQSVHEIFEDIRSADFISIDTNVEVTGLIMTDESLNLEQLEGADWYNVLLSKQKARSPLEFGIAMFKEDKTMSNTKKTFHVKCYNIPILMAYVEEHDARQDIRDRKDFEERFDIDSIGFEFMQKINFDLNKSLYDGAPFLNKERSLEAKDYMEKNPDFMIINGKHVTNGDLDQSYFPKLIEKLQPEDIDEIVERLRGVGKFLEVTSEAKVPVIGHNLFVKLILLYKDFVEFLPNTYSELIPKLETLIPEFYDTKFICCEIGENKNASDHERSITSNAILYPLYRNTSWIGGSSIDFALHETSTQVYESDLNELCMENLEDDSTSFCYECGFDSFLAGIIFTKLAILTFREFKVEEFPKYAKRWKNKPYIQKEIQNVLYDHEKPKKGVRSVAGPSSSSRPEQRVNSWTNVIHKK